LCGTCMEARGLDDTALMAGARRSTMDELATARRNMPVKLNDPHPIPAYGIGDQES
jgi:hypothetical protein